MVFVNANETHLFNSYCTRKMSSALKKIKIVSLSYKYQKSSQQSSGIFQTGTKMNSNQVCKTHKEEKNKTEKVLFITDNAPTTPHWIHNNATDKNFEVQLFS